MKKMIFTAMSILLFSSVSIANTKETVIVKESKEVKTTVQTEEEEKETPQCYYGWIAVYETSGVQAADAWGRAHGC